MKPVVNTNILFKTLVKNSKARALEVGLDSNILAYMLDKFYPEHKFCNFIPRLSSNFMVAVNPTVIHETYHTLVYGQKWSRQDARRN